MVNLKSYKDGDRFVLVIENCKGEVAKKVGDFVQSLMGLDNDMKQVPLEPVKVVDEVAPNEATLTPIRPVEIATSETETFVCGPYTGMSVNEAINKDGTKAAIFALANKNTIPSMFMDKMVSECKEYLRPDVFCRLETCECSTVNDFIQFMELYRPLIEEPYKAVLNQLGESDEGIETFVTENNESLVIATYQQFLETLMEAL